jgi:hypothetical protein
MVAPVSHCLNKSRSCQAAGLAEGLGIRMVTARRSGKVRNAQILPAANAEGACLRRELRTAEITDRDTGKTQEGTATKHTRAGKQCTRKAVRGTSQHTHNSPPNRSLRQRDVESQGNTLTRKDAPHSRPARLAAALPPMGRVYGQVKPQRQPMFKPLSEPFHAAQPVCRQ